jgi:hypothetical protein
VKSLPDDPAAAPRRAAWTAAALGLVLLYWTWRMLPRANHGILLGLVDLAFHEAGHIIFTPFGSTLHYLGGSLGQIMVPALLGWYFLARRGEPLGAAFCLWWVGENLAGIARYMADARDLSLPLVGGGDHDWNELFYRFGVLGEEAVRTISGLTRALGLVTMAGGLGWIGALAARPLLSRPRGSPGPGCLQGLRSPRGGPPAGASPPPAIRRRSPAS